MNKKFFDWASVNEMKVKQRWILIRSLLVQNLLECLWDRVHKAAQYASSHSEDSFNYTRARRAAACSIMHKPL